MSHDAPHHDLTRYPEYQELTPSQDAKVSKILSRNSSERTRRYGLPIFWRVITRTIKLIHPTQEDEFGDRVIGPLTTEQHLEAERIRIAARNRLGSLNSDPAGEGNLRHVGNTFKERR